MNDQNMRAIMTFIPSRSTWMCRTNKQATNSFLVCHPDPVVAYSEWLKIEIGAHPEFSKRH